MENPDKIHETEELTPACCGFNKFDSIYSWFVAISGFLIQFWTLGIINNIGQINSFWEESFQVSQGTIAWAGSLSYGVLFASGPFVAAISNKIGCQLLSVIGSVIGFLGLISTTYCKTFTPALICYGCLFGFGASCCFFSSIFIQPKYFKKRITSANGFISAGSGAGTLLLSAFLYGIYEKYGWKRTFGYMSVIYPSIMIFSINFNDIRIRVPRCFTFRDTNARPNLKLSPWHFVRASCLEVFPLGLFKNYRYTVFTVSCFFFMFGYLVPYINTVSYAKFQGVESSQASLLIGTMALTSLFSKLISSRLAELPFMNPVYMMTASFITISLSCVGAVFCKSYVHFVIFTIVFGLADGTYACLVPFIVGDFVGFNNLGGGIGLLFAIKSIPLILGGPIAGMLYDYTKTYTASFLYSSGFTGFAGLLMFGIILRRNQVLNNNYTLLEEAIPLTDHLNEASPCNDRAKYVITNEEDEIQENNETHVHVRV